MKKLLIVASIACAVGAGADNYAPEHLGVAKANAQIAQQQIVVVQHSLRQDPYNAQAQLALQQAAAAEERARWEAIRAQEALRRQQRRMQNPTVLDVILSPFRR